MVGLASPVGREMELARHRRAGERLVRRNRQGASNGVQRIHPLRAFIVALAVERQEQERAGALPTRDLRVALVDLDDLLRFDEDHVADALGKERLKLGDDASPPAPPLRCAVSSVRLQGALPKMPTSVAQKLARSLRTFNRSLTAV